MTPAYWDQKLNKDNSSLAKENLKTVLYRAPLEMVGTERYFASVMGEFRTAASRSSLAGAPQRAPSSRGVKVLRTPAGEIFDAPCTKCGERLSEATDVYADPGGPFAWCGRCYVKGEAGKFKDSLKRVRVRERSRGER